MSAKAAVIFLWIPIGTTISAISLWLGCYLPLYIWDKLNIPLSEWYCIPGLFATVVCGMLSVAIGCGIMAYFCSGIIVYLSENSNN